MYGKPISLLFPPQITERNAPMQDYLLNPDLRLNYADMILSRSQFQVITLFCLIVRRKLSNQLLIIYSSCV